MSVATETPGLRLRAARAQSALRRGADALEAVPPLRVIAVFVVVEWLAVLALALTVQHNGWVYYQGGDQLYYYTLGWLLSHGVLFQTPVGYLWSTILTPFAAAAGPNLASALPAIVLFDVLVLLPTAMLALYGIGSLLGGRLFGYWTLLAWVVVPFLGILYTNAGYHQKYTELLLPQGFGLTGMADFPAMVCAVVSLYFCLRAVLADRRQLLDAVLGGAAAGCAIAVKPSASLILAGPILAFAWRRDGRAVAAFVGAMLPAVATLALWKERGLGNLPLFQGAGARPLGGLAALHPLVALNLGRYLNLDWSRLGNNIDLLREHFWSGHLVVWLALAGLVGIGRRSFGALLLLGGAYLPMLIVKGAYDQASVEDGSVFRILMPCFPIFVLVLASLPLVVPSAPRLLREWRPARPQLPVRARLGALAAVILISAAVPLVAFAAADRSSTTTRAAFVTGTPMPIPIDVPFGLRASVSKSGTVLLTWRNEQPLGGAAIYRVLREPASQPGDGVACPATSGGLNCTIAANPVGDTRQPARYDKPGPGAFVYRVGLVVNWENSPDYGDIYVISKPLLVHVP